MKMAKIDIPIGKTGEIDGIKVMAKSPENYIDLCHGCHFDTDNTYCIKHVNCRQPDRIFKLIIE
jgi:hypothetical protein